MEATGSDGGRGPPNPWSYRGDQIGSIVSYDNSISSSTSGTIVSATYTSGASHLSSISMDEVRHFEFALDEDAEPELARPTKKSCKEREMKHMHIKSLVQEFFGAPSAERGDMSVLERWFSDLGVAWILHLPDGDDASAQLHHNSVAAAAESWIRGLRRILEAIRSTPTLFGGVPDVSEKDQHGPDTDKQANDIPYQIQLARFIREAISKLIPFVDIATRQVVCNHGMLPTPYKKLHILLAVYKALSDAHDKVGVASILQETSSLLSAKQEEAGDAIWSTMERIRTHVWDSIDTSSSLIPHVSSDIHEATMAAMEYMRFLCSNSSSMDPIAYKAFSLGKYVSQFGFLEPLHSMVRDMNSCLQEKLVKISESFPNQGLRFLFLLNNFEFILNDFEFIQQSLAKVYFPYTIPFHKESKGLSKKVEGYIENYLQACWEPLLSCLFSPTPLCFRINHSPLLKFESEFNKAYATQKLLKVPDPDLRESLRRTITKKIVPRYTKYIEENNITTPGVAPEDLEKMLQELFEG